VVLSFRTQAPETLDIRVSETPDIRVLSRHGGGVGLLDQPEPDRKTMPFTPPFTNERQLVFTASQAARYLGVSLATIRRWADAGHISCYRTPGGQRRFSREQLDNFITSLDHKSNGAHHIANVA
jgi:excisionase family DNA binding protein